MLHKQHFNRARMQRGLSLERLAHAAGISVSYAAAISSGAVPSHAVRSRVALVLGLHESELWVDVVSDDPEAV